MKMLANRQVFHETEYGSDVFVNNRMSSILLSSHEKNLRGFVAHWYEPIIHYHCHHPRPKYYAYTGLMMVTVRPRLHSKRFDLRTPINQPSKSITECLSGTTSVDPREPWLVKDSTKIWSVQSLSYTED